MNKNSPTGFLDAAKRHLMQVSDRPDFVAVSGRGSWLRSSTGVEYLDFVQGRGTNVLGHCDPEIQRTVALQLDQLVQPGSYLYNDMCLELAHALTSTSGFYQAFFASSGAEANEAAIKLARKWGRLRRRQAPVILAFEGGFHGRTLGAMSTTRRVAWKEWFGPLCDGFVTVPFNDIVATSKVFTPDVCAVLVEPIQGEAGVRIAAPEFLHALRRLCDRNDALLIFDEVQTGIGRTGSLFAHQTYGVTPDVMVLGKGIANGLPLSAIVAKEHACVFEHGDHGGTFNGGPVVCAAALSTLSRVGSGEFLRQVRDSAQLLQEALSGVVKRFGGQEAGLGLMRRICFDAPVATALVRYCRDALPGQRKWENRGVLLNAPQPEILRFLPALNISQDEIEQLVAALTRALAATCNFRG